MDEQKPRGARIWDTTEGIVTEADVDSVRSWANAQIRNIRDASFDSHEEKYAAKLFSGFLLGAALDDDDSIALAIVSGRKIRRAAGDTPTTVTAHCLACMRDAHPRDLVDGICPTCRALARTCGKRRPDRT